MEKRITLFLFAVCIVLAGYVVGTRMKMDKTGPEISFEDKISFQEDMDEEDLLKGVKAYDEIDGDVSDSLTVESVYPVDDTKVVVVYVAMDSKNNITKVKRELSCRDEKDSVSDDEKENEDSKSQSKDSTEVSDKITPTVTPALTKTPVPTEPVGN